MTSNLIVSYGVIVAAFITQCTMLTLQVRALKRHGHKSFLLLSIATTSGILALALLFAARWLGREASDLGFDVRLGLASLLLIQMALGVWGTASLFRSYRLLTSHATEADAAVGAPN